MRCFVTSLCLLAFTITNAQARLSAAQLRKSLMVSPSFSHRRAPAQPQNRNIVLPVDEGPNNRPQSPTGQVNNQQSNRPQSPPGQVNNQQSNRPQSPPGQVNNQQSNRPIVPPGQERNRQSSGRIVSESMAQNRHHETVSTNILPEPSIARSENVGTVKDVNGVPGNTINRQTGKSNIIDNRITPIIKPIKAGKPMRPHGANAAAVPVAIVGDIKATNINTEVNTKENRSKVKPIINDRIVDTVNEKSTPPVESGITQRGRCEFNIPATLLPDPRMTEQEFNRTILIPTIREYLNPDNRPCVTDALKRYIYMLLRWREMAFSF